jgi:hypothetical protein
MFKSQNKYALSIEKSPTLIKEILSRNTLYKKYLVRALTPKLFIGQVNDDGFYIIESSARGVACTLKGKFKIIDKKTTLVEIETNLHKAFTILSIIFAAFVVVAAIVTFINQAEPISMELFLIPLFAGVLYRLFIHVVYILARNRSIRELEFLLKR